MFPCPSVMATMFSSYFVYSLAPSIPMLNVPSLLSVFVTVIGHLDVDVIALDPGDVEPERRRLHVELLLFVIGRVAELQRHAVLDPRLVPHGVGRAGHLQERRGGEGK